MKQLKYLFTRNPTIAPITRYGLRWLSFCARHNPLQRYSKRVESLRYLNVGCGKKPHDHTINLNYEWYPFIDLTWDIAKPLPLKTGSLDGVYCEHVLEHLAFEGIPAILKDWFRVLKPDGTLRILVPDAELYLRTYMAIREGDSGRRFPYHDETATPMIMVNRCFRSYDHHFAYDFETFKRLLKNTGFRSIERKGHNEGRDAKLLIDSDERECESLRIECIKPG